MKTHWYIKCRNDKYNQIQKNVINTTCYTCLNRLKKSSSVTLQKQATEQLKKLQYNKGFGDLLK